MCPSPWSPLSGGTPQHAHGALGTPQNLLLLSGQNRLLIRQRVHVRKAGRAGRQRGDVREVRVVIKSSRGGGVDHSILVNTRRLAGDVEAYHGAAIIRRGAPVFDKAKEVVSPSVGPEVSPWSGGISGIREGIVLTADDRHPPEGVRGAGAAANVCRVGEVLSVYPGIREQRDGVGEYRRRHMAFA